MTFTIKEQQFLAEAGSAGWPRCRPTALCRTTRPTTG